MVTAVQRAAGVFVLGQILLAALPLPLAHAQRQAVVFIAPPQVPEETIQALDEAVAAHVSLLGVDLVFLTAERLDAGLEERMTLAEAQAQNHDAIGVFWIDVRPSGRWFLYIMDRSGAHVVVRPLSTSDASVDAAIETAAVIAGSATDALLKQQSVEARLTQPEKRKPERRDSELRLELAYSGTIFSPSVPWVHGLAMGGSWLWASGPYVGLSYTWSPPVVVERPEARFQVTRYPILLHGGARVRVLDALEVGGELALGIELRARETTFADAPLGEVSSQTRPVYVASLRGVIEFRITEWLAILARVCPELVINSFDYLKKTEPGDPEVTVYLSPYELRFTAQLGLAIVR